MTLLFLVAGVMAVFLGVLWLLQGLALLTIPPILCVAACEPVEGGSAAWAAAGLVVIAAGVLAVVYGLKRRARG